MIPWRRVLGHLLIVSAIAVPAGIIDGAYAVFVIVVCYACIKVLLLGIRIVATED